MPHYCDVALPVPVDRVFTYSIGDALPVVGGRVLAPFRREELQGIVVALHDQTPAAETRPVLRALDHEPVLSEELLQLGTWVSQYYLAPLGEVLRAMLPLGAEVRREALYGITERGHASLAAPKQRKLSKAAGEDGTDGDATDEDATDDLDHAVLTFLAKNGVTRAAVLRAKTSAPAATLQRLIARQWIERATTATPQPARTVRTAVLTGETGSPKLNDNQQRLLRELAGAGGRLPVRSIQALSLPSSTLSTLVRRELVRIESMPAEGIEGAFHPPRELAGSASAGATTLNHEQREAMRPIAASIDARKFQPFLLHGVTGSGKTAIYIAAMRHALDAGFSSLLLVPEIGLTPAMAAQLRSSFGQQVALLHSALNARERTVQWHRIRRGEAHVIVGTRSAVFAPVSNLALIVVDEEHDTSYKQADMPRYHARDVAVMRARSVGATIVLGSATPSLESWANAQSGKYTLLSLKKRIGRRPMPEISLIDMGREFAETGQDHLLSRALQEEIEATLGRGEQAILLLNRRGYSLVVMCRACSAKLECENCAISLTHHKSGGRPEPGNPVHQRMECHYCGFRRTVPKHCPQCGSEHLYFFGVGSQQGEERLQEIFPRARIARMDRDTMRHGGDYERILDRLHSGEVNLLVGTQMIAKGHDIHGVTLVGVIGIDHALSLPDFRSAERVFQLLTQVAGRAGRGELPGRVLVQTHYLDHYAVRCAAEHNYAGFVDQELRFRRLLHYPPATVLTNVLIEHSDLTKASQWASQLGEWWRRQMLPGVRILGPAAAPIARIKRIHRLHLVVKASSRKQLAEAMGRMLAFAESVDIPRRYLGVDVDAIQLM